MLKTPSLWFIGLYQRYLSGALPPSCRFQPSCSEYTRQALQKYGGLRGWMLGIRRLAKCHPFHPGGYDPLT
ncbi:MAG: membrane protein insertion efficiency factor YidD [Deltaproteobacteria bacterium CG_4_9_14_3_um_filter_63_12]|nr:MAG: membrane protein insertion efficiency factor YidD [Deltaproteobacteria bacterium CG17_big_fil_post_rev_8_21_14_2_50_63_7]PJB37944.1 MAG: membrane protein insertion efficiency factor YidD [Deltaproteobacteria bacterium CG_4_9_14_3_um_filter_63_12]